MAWFRALIYSLKRQYRNRTTKEAGISKLTKGDTEKFIVALLICAIAIATFNYLAPDYSRKQQGQYSQYAGDLRMLDKQLTTVDPKRSVMAVQEGEVSRSISGKDGKDGRDGRELILESTAYTWTGSRTATGTWPRQGRTVAVNPATIPFHSKIYIEGVGWRIAEDRIPEKSIEKGAQVDIYMDRENDCWDWGRRDVRVRVVEPPESKNKNN